MPKGCSTQRKVVGGIAYAGAELSPFDAIVA
jgi:hypothetical protein